MTLQMGVTACQPQPTTNARMLPRWTARGSERGGLPQRPRVIRLCRGRPGGAHWSRNATSRSGFHTQADRAAVRSKATDKAVSLFLSWPPSTNDARGIQVPSSLTGIRRVGPECNGLDGPAPFRKIGNVLVSTPCDNGGGHQTFRGGLLCNYAAHPTEIVAATFLLFSSIIAHWMGPSLGARNGRSDAPLVATGYDGWPLVRFMTKKRRQRERARKKNLEEMKRETFE
ncbi:hypothetical protein B0J18DRAFT_231746 [Chaetomium sp. MPI-SDFR-AT-0129]|nr:hypothetical protein B0J18DRAFT_231746 [Chaetomium sp. MPI-SDFR-AT-0129]